jgi:signal transduction histidine kinase
VLPAGARLALDHEEGLQDLEVLADPDFTRMILDNLVDNALKYGGSEPEVTIQARSEGSRVTIEVSDSGVGFEPGDAETLFVPFERMSAAAASQSGTGLGLSISRGLARRMGGDVTAESEGPGRGSRFTLWIPGRPS